MTISQEVDSTWSDEFRKEVFLALVETQDQNISVKDSRADVAKRFGLTSKQVQTIEREGIDGQWPPLT
jgi:transposase-like protein